MSMQRRLDRLADRIYKTPLGPQAQKEYERQLTEQQVQKVATAPGITVSIKQVPLAPRGNFDISKGGSPVGSMQLEFLPDESTVRLVFLTIVKPGIVNRKFLIDLWNEVDKEARVRGLAFTEIRPFPKQEKMYLGAGFSEYSEAGEVISLRRPVVPESIRQRIPGNEMGMSIPAMREQKRMITETMPEKKKVAKKQLADPDAQSALSEIL